MGLVWRKPGVGGAEEVRVGALTPLVGRGFGPHDHPFFPPLCFCFSFGRSPLIWQRKGYALPLCDSSGMFQPRKPRKDTTRDGLYGSFPHFLPIEPTTHVFPLRLEKFEVDTSKNASRKACEPKSIGRIFHQPSEKPG